MGQESLGIIIRQSIKGSIVSFGGVGISAITILFFYPWFLSPAEIGLLAFLETVAWTFLSFGSLGVFNITDKFFPFFKDQDAKHNGYLVFLLGYLLLGFLLALLVLLVFKDFWLSIYAKKAPQALDYFYYIIPFIFSLMYFSLLESYARVHLRIVVPSFYRDVALRIFILISVVGYGFDLYGFTGLVILRIGAFFLATLGLLLYLNHLKILFLRSPFPFLTKSLLREITQYGFFIVLGGLSNLVISKVDMLMIPAFLGTNELGVYALAFFMGTIIEVPRKALGQISTPIIAQAWANKDLEMIQKIYRGSSLNQWIVGLLIFLLIWLNVDAIFEIIPNGERFIEGKYVILFIALTRLVDMITGVNSEILIQSNYYRFNLVALALLAVLNISLNLVLIPTMGIAGAALATLIAFIVFNLAKGFFIWFKFEIHPFSKNIFGVGLVGGLIYSFVLLLPSLPIPFLDIAFKSTLITGLFGVGMLFFKLSPEMSALWKKVLQIANEKLGRK